MVPRLPILRGGNANGRWEYDQNNRTFTRLWATSYTDWWSPNDGSGLWRRVRWTLRIGEMENVRENNIENIKEVWDWAWADDEEMPAASTAAATTAIEIGEVPLLCPYPHAGR